MIERDDVNEVFIVLGLRDDTQYDPEGEPSLSFEILGAFTTLENAVISQDIHSRLDTTVEMTTITSAVVLDEVPEMDLYLHICVQGEEIYIRSQCVTMDANVRQIENATEFDYLAYPEDRDEIVSRASAWIRRRGGTPKVIDEVSPEAESYMNS